MKRKKHFNKKFTILAIIVIIIVVAIFIALSISNNLQSIFGLNNGNENGNVNNYDNSTPFLYNNDITLPSEFDIQSLMEIHFIDVGQGDAFVINCPDDKTIIIDAGSVTTGINEIEEEYIDYLSNITNDKTIDYMLVTHPHTDHYNMLDSVLENYDVSKIYYNENEEDSKNYENFINLSKNEPNIVFQQIDHNSLIDTIIGTNYTLDIYACGDSAFDSANELNNMSIMCLLTYNDRQILFTGDAEIDTEQWFMDVYGDDLDIDIDILKIGHHGSRTATSNEFLDYLEPEYAIISCDDGTKYGHPHQETINKLNEYGIVTYITNLQGNIVLLLDSDGDFGFITEKDSEVLNNSNVLDDKIIDIAS